MVGKVQTPPLIVLEVGAGLGRKRRLSGYHLQDGLEIDEGIGEGIELCHGVSVSDIGMFEGGLVGVCKETFDGGAFFEDVFEGFGLSVEHEAELVRIVEVDGFGTSFFGWEVGVVAGTRDGALGSFCKGIGTLVSSPAVSFGSIEPGRFGFPFLATRSDGAPVWTE